MNVNVQCVYGDDNVAHIYECLLPILANTCKYKINFVSMNYRKGGRTLPTGDYYGVRVIDFPKETDVPTGFAENHNFLFNKTNPTDFFVLINPDCIPLEGSIDCLIKKKLPDVAIVEGRQWPFEHPKEYDEKTFETPWASGAFELIDSKFYKQIGGMDPLYFLYDEDVDLSWQAWLNGYRVIYEPSAQIIHFTNGNFHRLDMLSNERYFSLRNFILISRKFFGKKGEVQAIKSLKKALICEQDLFYDLLEDYKTNILPFISERYVGQRHNKVKILGINLFAKHNGVWS